MDTNEHTHTPHRRTRAITVFAALATIAMLAVTASCGVGAGNGVGQGTDGNGGAADASAVCKAPDFQGPYADEFKRSYDSAKTELGKRILADCKVTDAELNEVFDAQNACTAPYGIVSQKGSSTQINGTLTEDEVQQKYAECAGKTDLWNVESMYDALAGNPDNISPDDWERKVFACLRDHKLTPEGMDEHEYMDIVNEQNNPDTTEQGQRRWQEAFGKYDQKDDSGRDHPDYQQYYGCLTDPLHQ